MRKILMVTAVPNDVSSVSTTSATPNPTMPIKMSIVSTRKACWTRAKGGWEGWLPLIWWAWTKQIASEMPSNSSIVQKERRARVAAVIAVDWDVSSCTRIATIAPA